MSSARRCGRVRPLRDRKDDKATAHVGRQWLSRLGKAGNGIVTVSTPWTGGRVY
ncbi:hypothetical protein [Streptomyces sp. NPDC005859]|uniref:hypothetical protein n=1 Tax=Streptomyces sp. NPDC005859 TaxID=3157170 RepID=UPI0033C426C1